MSGHSQFVFVVKCHECNELIKIADDPSGGQEQYIADDIVEDLLCPNCHHSDLYQANELRRVQAAKKH